MEVSGPEKLKMKVFGVRGGPEAEPRGIKGVPFWMFRGPQKLKMKVFGVRGDPEAEPRGIKGVPFWTFRGPTIST